MKNILIMVLFIVLCLSGCAVDGNADSIGQTDALDSFSEDKGNRDGRESIATSKDAPNDKELISLIEEDIANYTLDGTKYKSSITKIDIVRQKTDDRTCTTVCEIELQDENLLRKENVTIISSFWDKGGWVLDSWETNSPEIYSFIPVFDSNRILDSIIALGYHRDSLCEESRSDLENGCSLSLTAYDEHENLTAHGQIIGTATLEASVEYPKSYNWNISIDESGMRFNWNNLINYWECDFVHPVSPKTGDVHMEMHISSILHHFNEQQSGRAACSFYGYIKFWRYNDRSGRYELVKDWYMDPDYNPMRDDTFLPFYNKPVTINSDGLFQQEGNSLSNVHLIRDLIIFDGNDWDSRIDMYFYPDEAFIITTHNYYVYYEPITAPLVKDTERYAIEQDRQLMDYYKSVCQLVLVDASVSDDIDTLVSKEMIITIDHSGCSIFGLYHVDDYMIEDFKQKFLEYSGHHDLSEIKAEGVNHEIWFNLESDLSFSCGITDTTTGYDLLD